MSNVKEGKSGKRKSTKKGVSRKSTLRAQQAPVARKIDFKKASIKDINEHITSLDLDPMSESDLQMELGQYLYDYGKILTNTLNKQNIGFDDYICTKLLTNEKNECVLMAAVEMDRIIRSMEQLEINSNLHPQVLFFNRILGVNGFSRPEQCMINFYMQLRESLDKEYPQSQEIITFQAFVEWMKKNLGGVS